MDRQNVSILSSETLDNAAESIPNSFNDSFPPSDFEHVNHHEPDLSENEVNADPIILETSRAALIDTEMNFDDSHSILSSDEEDTVLSNKEDNSDERLKVSLRKWGGKHGCTRECLNELLKILSEHGHSLPKDGRTLLRTDQNLVSKILSDGQYAYIGILEGLKASLENQIYDKDIIKLRFNIDGLPLFKSSSLQLWPILAAFDEFNPFPVALFCGDRKPDLKDYLKEFIEELTILTTDMPTINNKKYTCEIQYFICDAPARALLKGIVQHTGYHACERCNVKGSSCQNRIIFHCDLAAESRTDTLFRSSFYAQKDSNGKSHQLSISPLINLNFDMIKGFILDYMHMVCLGVTRRILYFLKGNFKGVFHGRLSAATINIMSTLLTSFSGCFPSEFARQPRSLREIDRWKATEFRTFLLYSGLLVLKGNVSEDVYKHFLSLSLAIRFLCSDDDEERHTVLEFAKNLLNYFVVNSRHHYGNSFCVYNVHGLLHLSDDVVHSQVSLDKISAFPFENYLQKLKRLVRGKHNPVTQILRRLDELGSSENTAKNRKVKMKEGRKDSCFLVRNGVVILQKLVKENTYECNFWHHSFLESLFTSFIDSKEINIYFANQNISSQRMVKGKEVFLQKCVLLPYKLEHAVIPMLKFNN